MSAEYRLEVGDVDALASAMSKAGERAGSIVDGYLRDQGAEAIEREISARLPESGRRWRGKKTAAKKTKPFQRKFSPLAVTIQSKSDYDYLYFPDDGSNTKRHRGNQHFMRGGAEAALDGILDGILSQLSAIFE